MPNSEFANKKRLRWRGRDEMRETEREWVSKWESSQFKRGKYVSIKLGADMSFLFFFFLLPLASFDSKLNQLNQLNHWVDETKTKYN